MTKTRRARRVGGGYQTSQQFFDPAVLPPSAGMFAPVVSSAPTENAIRPIMYSTFQTGAGHRRTRRSHGGFYPGVMGGFIPNAQAAIVPASLYLVYHTMVPKKGAKSLRSLGSRAMKSVKRMFSRRGGRRV